MAIDLLDKMDYNKINTYRIKEARALRHQMEDEAEKYKKLAKLAYDDEIKVVKENANYLYLDLCMEHAKKWLHVLKSGTKNDKNEKREWKEHYNFLVKRLNDLFGFKVKKIEEICQFGWDCSAYIVDFKIKNDNVKELLQLWVPVIDKLNKENYEMLDFGKLRLLSHTGKNSTRLICDSYDIEELKEEFKKWLEERTNGK